MVPQTPSSLPKPIDAALRRIEAAVRAAADH